MKNAMKLTQVLGLLCLSVGTVSAQTPAQPTTPVQPNQPTPRNQDVQGQGVQGNMNQADMQQMQKMDVQQLLNRFDNDKDGNITKNELPTRLKDEFAKCDKNNDGKLDKEELREHALKMNARSDQGQQGYIMVYEAVYDPISLNDLQGTYEMLSMIDENHDGKITQEEVTAAQQKIRRRHADSVFQEWDKDNDGKLMKTEVPTRLMTEFNKVDTDSDGSISKEEMEEAFVSKPMNNDNNPGNNTPGIDRNK